MDCGVKSKEKCLAIEGQTLGVKVSFCKYALVVIHFSFNHPMMVTKLSIGGNLAPKNSEVRLPFERVLNFKTFNFRNGYLYERN